MQDTNYSSWNILLSFLEINAKKNREMKNEFSFFTIHAKKYLPVGRIVQTENNNSKKIINMEYSYFNKIEQKDFQVEEYYANTNLLFCDIEKYHAMEEKILNELPFFVNSKKKDKSYPLRLEKMMQDISCFFDAEKVNVIYGDKEESFTPFKVNLKDYRKNPSPLLAEQTLPYNLEFFFINAQKILSKNNFFEEAQPKKYNDDFTFNCQGKVSLHPLYFISKNISFKNIVDNSFSTNSFVALNGLNIIFKNNQIADHSALILNVDPEAILIVENLKIENKGFKEITIADDAIQIFDYKAEEVPIINVAKKGTFKLNQDLSVTKI